MWPRHYAARRTKNVLGRTRIDRDVDVCLLNPCEQQFLDDYFVPQFLLLFFFFLSSRRRHTSSLRYWSSDVCSSDLAGAHLRGRRALHAAAPHRPRRLGRAWRGARTALRTGPPGALRCKGSSSSRRALRRWSSRSEERRVGKEGRARWGPGPGGRVSV